MGSLAPGGAVTVVIPVWDRYVEFLPEAVASVVDQRAARVIVVDNASAVPLPPLAGARVIRAQQRLTTGAARNLGLEAVDTPFVVFLDADDIMLPGSLASMVDELDAQDDATAWCRAILVLDTGRPHRAPRASARRLAAFPRVFAFANSVWLLLPTQGATIMRTEAVRAAGGYADSSLGEEWELASALAWRGRIGFGSDPALVYRWRGDPPRRSGGRATLLQDARSVRRRLRQDRATPRVARRLLPLIALGQWTAITIVRPPWRLARLITTPRARTRSGSPQ